MTEPSGNAPGSEHGFTNRIVKMFLESNLSLILILLATVVGRLAEGAPQRGVDQVVEFAVAGLCAEDDPIWLLVERVAAIRRASPDQLALVNAILDAVATHVSPSRGSRFAVGRSRAASGGIPGASPIAGAGEPEVDE